MPPAARLRSGLERSRPFHHDLPRGNAHDFDHTVVLATVLRSCNRDGIGPEPFGPRLSVLEQSTSASGAHARGVEPRARPGLDRHADGHARRSCRRSRPSSILAGMTPILPTHEVVAGGARLQLASSSCHPDRHRRLGDGRPRRGRGAPGRPAARLHGRIVGLFSLVAALPAILVALVAIRHPRARASTPGSPARSRRHRRTPSRSPTPTATTQCRTLAPRDAVSWRTTSTERGRSSTSTGDLVRRVHDLARDLPRLAGGA